MAFDSGAFDSGAFDAGGAPAPFRVSTSATFASTVRNLAATTKAGAFSVRSLVQQQRAAAFSVRNLAAGEFTGAWSVEQGLVRVATQRTLAYSIRAEISGQQAHLLRQLARLHGLIEPLTIDAGTRQAGALQQRIEQLGDTVTISTDAIPMDEVADAGLHIEELAALHGLTADLVVSPTLRQAGAIVQELGNAGGITTVVRQ